jgi:hypothetical protein
LTFFIKYNPNYTKPGSKYIKCGAMKMSTLK